MDNNDVSNNGGQYRATSNLNTAIENPELNINNTMGVNIQNDNQESDNNNLDSMENSSFDDNQLYQSNMVSNEDNNQLYQSNVVSGESDSEINQSNNITSNESSNGVDLNTNASFEDNDNKIYKSNILSDYVNDNNSNSYDASSIENNRVMTGNDDVSLEKKNLDGNEGTNTFVPDTSSYVPNGEYAADNSNEKYEPVMENNKKTVKIAVPRDFKIILFIIFILVIFVLLMPYIYDFFRGLGLVITNNGK